RSRGWWRARSGAGRPDARRKGDALKAFVTVVLVAIAASLVVAATHVVAQGPALAERGERAFMNQGCYGCHTVGKVGTPLGPDLSHVGAKYRPDYLSRWLRDPSSVRPLTHMPALELTDDDVRSIAAFLASRQ